MRWLGASLAALLVLSGCTSVPPAIIDEAWSNPLLTPGVVEIQIDHVAGRAPTPAAWDALTGVLRELGVEAQVEVRASLPGGGAPYTSDDLLRLHLEYYVGESLAWRGPNALPRIHVLYLDGNSTALEGNAQALGLAFGRGGFPLVAIFPDLLRTTSLYAVSTDVPGQNKTGYERAVLVHEFGHLLGLVGCGLEQGHARMDPANECHSSNRASVMFPNMHSSPDPVAWALDDDMQPVWRFDADDWADIRAGQRAIANGT